ncbi:PLAC8 motif-containing protein [Arabidopsis suecica]|uniref:PLAC8 motif-containing protein n=1 Tax=Arabidopsis suecica TaxID=45249 RepID=A0A8T2CK36_ARASU|nr:PLAC8 motif-containing protein [Arabidopsis suecica]
MGRPDGNRPDGSPSPRMNNNYNPMFHAQATPEPPVYEKQMVPNEQKYPNNGGRGDQPSGVPMGRPGQPTNINTGGMGSQPYGVQMVRPPPVINQPSNWTSGLFDCMNDGENAIITFCFPFVTFGQIAEVVDEGATSCGTSGMLYGLICCLFGIPCIYSCTFRAKLRNKYGLPDAPAPDWITHCFCEYCALCQEFRELKNRGLDPSIGWIGNVQKQRMGQQQEMMAPPMGQRMMG